MRDIYLQTLDIIENFYRSRSFELNCSLRLEP